MRSIPFAMSWALYKRCRWQLLLAILGANWFPVFLLAALRSHGDIDPTESAFVTIQIVFIQLQIFAFGAALLFMHDFSRQMFTMPVTNAALVAGEMFPAMILMALQQLVSTAILNATFRLDWPLLSPVLFAPVAYAVVVAALWISDKSSWQPVCIGIAAAIIGLWFKSRHGALFSQPQHMWQIVTPLELVTLLAFAVAAYFVAVVGLSRSRRGVQLSLPALTSVGSPLQQSPTTGISDRPRFATPAAAQFWFEWHEKGWKLPGVVATSLIAGIVIWVIFSREPKLLVEGLVFGGGILSALAWIGGLIVGNCGKTDSDMPMGPFRGTRPLTDRDMARAILQTASGTVLISWTIWLATFLLILGILVATGSCPEPILPNGVKWWFFPATLLGCWALAATICVVCLSGHGLMWARIIFPTLITIVIDMMVSIFISREAKMLVQSVTQYVIGIIIGLIAVGVLLVSRRRSQIESWQLATAVVVWLAVSTMIVVEASGIPTVNPPFIVMLIGAAAWVVAPVAAAPLAVAWNRHRS
ncbi:MAG: hypothetical protein JSS49_01025 [Planctomycetes bacterium]|nr:hypothetical protein [Planctomycetota bacterium]